MRERKSRSKLRWKGGEQGKGPNSKLTRGEKNQIFLCSKEGREDKLSGKGWKRDSLAREQKINQQKEEGRINLWRSP